MTILLGYNHNKDTDGVNAMISQYTHSCGYVRAWIDPVDPLLIWLVPDCPADVLLSAMNAQISAFVTAQFSGTSAIADPYDRVQAIINQTLQNVTTWVASNAYHHLAQFLGNEAIIRPTIITELIKQGIIG